MKITVILLGVILGPATATAQQSEGGAKHTEIDYHCDKDHVFHTMCVEMEKRDKESQLRFEEHQAAEKAQWAAQRAEQAAEAKKLLDDANKVRSANQNERTDGIIGTAQDMNSHANPNPVSKPVTDKSLSAIGQFEHRKNELLEGIGKDVGSAASGQGGSTSSFNPNERHEVHESTKGGMEAHQLTPEQIFLNRANILLTTPSVRMAVVEAESTPSFHGSGQLTPGQIVENRARTLLASPETVSSVAQANLAVQAAERERLAIEAKKEAAHRAEIAERDRAQAEAVLIAEKEKEKEAAAEDAREAREERREQAREARAWRAAFEAAFGPPPTQATWSPSYVPTYIPNVASDSSSFVPSFISNRQSYASSAVPTAPTTPGSYSNLDAGLSAYKPYSYSSPDTTQSVACPGGGLGGMFKCLMDNLKAADAATDAAQAESKAKNAARAASDALASPATPTVPAPQTAQ
jgi:hypothetical protein